MTGLPFGTAFLKNHWQSPASPQGPPAVPLPTAAGYYAEKGKTLVPPASHGTLSFTNERR